MQCLCCSGLDYDQCCGPLLAGIRPAASPLALMRSRYTAFALNNFDYIYETTDPERRDLFDHDTNRDWMSRSTFTGLEVLSHSERGSKGTVEFIARFRRDGVAEQRHHERSQFRKHRGRWYFSDGETVQD
ncbi:MAG: zinc chelation protein SecC [Rhodopseudomonas sp.]|uniref:YchJ family protein n=1 Tax=Rhodopseudomonas sp. TaxID=1078 RepID=UPI00180A3D0A|nr:YchJ family metal-binding protein [Rhodopseudomonas sp.]NVN86640.1 zinc chelation protein SecC [Rhodopseudomonas sp.]